MIPGISDYDIVYIEANLKPRKVVKPPRKEKNFFIIKQTQKKISENLKTIDLNSLMTDQNPNIDHLWEHFKTENS